MRTHARRHRTESGAALILAIAFLVVVGGISAAIVSSITSGANQRATLDELRDRQYAADGAIEYAIAELRDAGGASAGYGDCLPGPDPDTWTLNDITIRVVCANATTVTENGFLQRNVIFSACLFDADYSDCNRERSDGSKYDVSIIRAQVNFEAVGDPLQIRRTWVQSWSVNG